MISRMPPWTLIEDGYTNPSKSAKLRYPSQSLTGLDYKSPEIDKGMLKEKRPMQQKKLTYDTYSFYSSIYEKIKSVMRHVKKDNIVNAPRGSNIYIFTDNTQ